MAVAIIKALSAQDMAAATNTMTDAAAEHPAVVSSLLQVWMVDAAVLREVKQLRAGVQQLVFDMASTHKQLRAAAGDITAAAMQAAQGAVAVPAGGGGAASASASTSVVPPSAAMLHSR